MSDTLLVSTRKGLFVLERGDSGWAIAHVAFLGDKVALALADARDGTWYAALDLGHFGAKLQRSTDRGRRRQAAEAGDAGVDLVAGGRWR